MVKRSQWGFQWAFLTTLLVFALQQELQGGVSWLIGYARLGHGAGLLLLCLPPLGCLALVCLFTMRLQDLSFVESLRFLGLKKPTAPQLVLAALCSLPLVAGYFFAFREYQREGTGVSLYPEWPYLAVLIFINAGLFEELTYRGFLFQCLRPGRSFPVAAALAAMLWNLSHVLGAAVDPHLRLLYSQTTIFLLGLSASYVFERSQNTAWAWIGVHWVLDSVGLFNIGNAGLFRTPIGPPVRFLFGGMLLCALIAFPLSRWILPLEKSKKLPRR